MELNAVDLATFGWKVLNGQIVTPAVRDNRLLGGGQARLRSVDRRRVPLRARMGARHRPAGVASSTMTGHGPARAPSSASTATTAS